MPRNSRILIVDDNAATRYAMRRVLERHGYRVEEAGNGGDGQAILARGQIDALVLDINLPDASGFDIARRLRAGESTARLPIVHVSAASIETQDLVHGLDAGADAYLIHPVDPDVLLATLRNLIRVRDAELALRASEAQFREIVANVAAPIAVVGPALDVQQINDAFRRLLEGVDTASLLLDALEPGQEAVVDALRQHLAHGERWRGILQVRGADGPRELEWRLSPHRHPGSGLVFAEDVTEQRQREREQQRRLDQAASDLAQESAVRARTEAQLLQSQKMDALGKLTGGIAHDFNNLLTSIITGTELLHQRISEGRAHEGERFIDAILGSARRAAGLTQRLLAFARKQNLDPQPVEVNARVRNLDELLRTTLGERIMLELQLSAGSMVARIDANQLENALINLVINARDAIVGAGSVCIRTEAMSLHGDGELPDGHYIALRVVDDGAGMPPEILDQVFEPFFTTKPIGQGTGLGLSMIYGFARQSGGDVRISSRPGLGTSVTLLLPAEAAAPHEAARTAPAAVRGQGEHILLVDDVASLRLVLKEALEDAGYRCTTMASGEQALGLLRSSASVDMLLTDVGLPGMNGVELADAARAWRPQLPVLLITGYASTLNEARGRAGYPHMMKPFAIGELLQRVADSLDPTRS